MFEWPVVRSDGGSEVTLEGREGGNFENFFHDLDDLAYDHLDDDFKKALKDGGIS